MTVKELIEVLQQMDPDKEVLEEGDEWEDVGFSFEKYNLYPVRSVEEQRDRVILRRNG